MMAQVENCACGEPLHYQDPEIEREMHALTEELGEFIPIQTPKGTYMVQRHYAALHGLRGYQIPELAKRLGFEKLP